MIYRSYRQHMMAFWAFALLAITMFWGASAYAITPANTIIKSRATVTYQDSLGNNFAAESNEATVVVAEVFSAILDPQPGQEKDGAIGQIVNFPHQLINNGNTADTFTISVAPVDGSTFVTDSLKVYLDTNGNGQADAGEPEIAQNSGQIVVAAGTTTNLVVAAQVPQGTTAPLSLTLTATSVGHTSFEEGTSATATSEDTINIVSDKPVLTITKEVISHTPPTWTTYADGGVDTLSQGSITYSVKVINNGADLETGAIYDFFPKYMDVKKHDETAGITVNLKSDARLGDPTFKEDLFAEAGLSKETDQHASGLKIPFASKLASGSNTSFEFTITYSAKDGDAFNFSGGEALENTVYVGHGEKSAIKTATSMWKYRDQSNTTSEVLPNLFDVAVSGPTEQPTDPVYGGGIVEYEVDVTNTGNSADSFNLSIKDPHTFPSGTTFSYWLGGVSLANNNTGSIPHEATVTVTVKAQLPENLTPAQKEAADKTATFVATSVGDARQHDSTELTLPTIGESSVDIAYSRKTAPGGNENPYPTTSPAPEGKPDGLKSTTPGTTVTFPLVVHNETGVSRSFSLKAYLSATGTFGAYTGTGQPELPVVFKKDGKVVTQTSQLAVSGEKSIEELTVVVTVPAGQEAKDYPFAVIADGGEKLNDAIAYNVRVNAEGGPVLTPDGSNQIAAGGATFYTHRLVNNSNTTRTFMVKGVNSAASWLHVMTTATPSEAGIVHTVDNAYVGAVLAPNQYLDFTVKVISPANAAPGSRDVLTLSVYEATNNKVFTSTGDALTTATDTTIVVEGQVRLYKKVHIIKGTTLGDTRTGSDNSKDTAAIAKAKTIVSSSFNVTPTEKVIPGEDYVVWQVIAINEGDAPAKAVVIQDAAPAFTDLVADSAYFVGNAEGGEGTDIGTVTIAGSNVTFTVTDKDVESAKVGLQPGASVEVRFLVKVQ